MCEVPLHMYCLCLQLFPTFIFMETSQCLHFAKGVGKNIDPLILIFNSVHILLPVSAHVQPCHLSPHHQERKEINDSENSGHCLQAAMPKGRALTPFPHSFPLHLYCNFMKERSYIYSKHVP